MSDNPYALLVELTIVVALLVSLVVYAMLRFMEAARTSRRRSKDSKEMVLLSAALHDAVAKLQAQERATAARADASERLSEEIILSLTAEIVSPVSWLSTSTPRFGFSIQPAVEFSAWHIRRHSAIIARSSPSPCRR